MSAPRVRVAGGPLVLPATLKQIDEWKHLGASYGEIIDRLKDFAVKRGFDPSTNTVNEKPSPLAIAGTGQGLTRLGDSSPNTGKK